MFEFTVLSDSIGPPDHKWWLSCYYGTDLSFTVRFFDLDLSNFFVEVTPVDDFQVILTFTYLVDTSQVLVISVNQISGRNGYVHASGAYAKIFESRELVGFTFYLGSDAPFDRLTKVYHSKQ